MQISRYLFVGALLCSPIAQATQVFKCTGADGKVSFTDRPCAQGEATQTLTIRNTDPNQPALPAGTREQRRQCAVLARPAWDLLPLEAAGQLDLSQAQQLASIRSELAAQCQQRIASSTLAFECREQMGVLTQATARAADPQYAGERDQLQAQYDLRCGEEAIIEDIVQHLREIPPPPPRDPAEGSPPLYPTDQ